MKILKNIQDLLKKDFAQKVMVLAGGSWLSQIINYGSILLLFRFYNEEAIGALILFSSLVVLMKPIFTLEYDLGILLPKKREDSINLVALIIVIAFLISLLSSGLFFFIQPYLSQFFDYSKLGQQIYLLPVGVFLVGFVSAMEYWNNRENRFDSISNALVFKSISISAVQLGFGLISGYPIWLIIGLLIGYLTQLFVLIRSSFKNSQELWVSISVSQMRKVAKQYADVPKYNTFISFLNRLSNEIPVLLITQFFGIGATGVYGLASKFTGASFGVFQQSISQVFFNKASACYNENGDLAALIRKNAAYFFRIALLLGAVLFIFSFFIDIFLGEKWIKVGLYIRILLPWLIIRFVSSPLTSLIVVLNKQRAILIYDIVLLLFRVVAFLVGYFIFNHILYALALFSLVGVVFNLIIMYYIYSVSKQPLKSYE